MTITELTCQYAYILCSGIGGDFLGGGKPAGFPPEKDIKLEQKHVIGTQQSLLHLCAKDTLKNQRKTYGMSYLFSVQIARSAQYNGIIVFATIHRHGQYFMQ
jgi:hypothetical protein